MLRARRPSLGVAGLTAVASGATALLVTVGASQLGPTLILGDPPELGPNSASTPVLIGAPETNHRPATPHHHRPHRSSGPVALGTVTLPVAGSSVTVPVTFQQTSGRRQSGAASVTGTAPWLGTATLHRSGTGSQQSPTKGTHKPKDPPAATTGKAGNDTGNKDNKGKSGNQGNSGKHAGNHKGAHGKHKGVHGKTGSSGHHRQHRHGAAQHGKNGKHGHDSARQQHRTAGHHSRSHGHHSAAHVARDHGARHQHAAAHQHSRHQHGHHGQRAEHAAANQQNRHQHGHHGQRAHGSARTAASTRTSHGRNQSARHHGGMHHPVRFIKLTGHADRYVKHASGHARPAQSHGHHHGHYRGGNHNNHG